MNPEKWVNLYEEITQMMGFDQAEDERAARVLDNLLKEKEPGFILDTIDLEDFLGQRKTAHVFGAADNLQQHINKFRKIRVDDAIIIASEGALDCVIKNGITPNIIVSDLDGPIQIIIDEIKRGIILSLHAHGDNIQVLERTIPELQGSIFPTCQTPGYSGVFVNPMMGFTDGDRAVAIASLLGCKKVILYGFNFKKPGKLHGKKPTRSKKNKLAFARRILESYQEGMTIQWRP